MPIRLTIKQLLWLCVYIFMSATSLASDDVFTVYLTRHMEKQADVKQNPSLTQRGQQQAETLSERLKNKGISAIYSTDYARTKETATPLARSLGIDVTIYDPKDLRSFANVIKSRKETALIVGHSNTTPAMTYLLSGQPQQDIDESDYNNLFEVVFGEDIQHSHLYYESPPSDTTGFHLAQANLRDIDARYQMMYRGKPVGTAIYNIDVQADTIKLVESTQIESFGIDTSITALVRKTDFAPLSMILNGTMGGPSDINLQWRSAGLQTDRQVSGTSLMPRAPYKAQGKLDIERDLPADVIERTSALLAIPFVDFEKTKSFMWYNGYEDNTRRITVTGMGMETITVPAGTFHTNKVKLEGGAPSQLFYLSNEPQPRVIKTEIYGIPWVYELTHWTDNQSNHHD